MFEIEAEEYSVGKAHEHYNYLFEEHAGSPVDFARWCFKDGVEFGYNKANEWHYVKDGDLPKTGNPCLVYLVNDCAIVARLREDNVWTTDGHNAFENVVAWKEIVLPKERE